MKLFSNLIAFTILLNCASGQGTFTVPEFLSGAQTQESVACQKSKLAYLGYISHELPRVEKIEFRTETNQFDLRQQQYALKISPNSRKAVKTQQQYQETNRYLAEMEINTELSHALRYRYELLVKYISNKRQLDIRQKLKILYSDMVTVLKRSISLPGFDILQLIEAEDEEQAIIREIFDLETALATMDKEMKRKTGSEKILLIEEGKLLNIQDLKAFFVKKASVELASHHQLQMLSARIYSSMMQYEWEATRTKFSLSYLQARYGYDPNDNFSKGFTIGIGFDIPLHGAARLDLNELQIQTYELESRFRDFKGYLLEQNNALTERLENLLQQHELVARQINESQAEYALKEYGKIAGASPKALLRLRENTLHKELILQKLELETMLSFIEYLDVSGQLAQKPFRNYLSKDFEQF